MDTLYDYVIAEEARLIEDSHSFQFRNAKAFHVILLVFVIVLASAASVL